MPGMTIVHLKEAAALLDASKTVIAERWVMKPTVTAVFKAHRIGAKKFTEGFGIPIIEYFIAVIREEHQAGDCPVMSRLVHYLLDKNITPRDVFDICMGFRRALIAFLFEKGELGEHAAEAMDEVAELFDANLSGVLEIFGSSYNRLRQQTDDALAQQRKFKQFVRIINAVSTEIVMVEHGRVVLANAPFFRMVGVRDLQEFHRLYPDEWSFASGVDTDASHFTAEHIEGWLKRADKRDRPFKLQVHHHALGRDFTYSGRVTQLPDSDPVRYLMTLNNIDAHMIDEAEEIARLRQDDLTQFWSYAWFEHLLAEAREDAKKRGRQLALAVIDVPDLAAINLKEGREAGDMLLKEVASDIASTAEASMLIARLEGSRFGILMEVSDPQRCYEWCMALKTRMTEKPGRKSVALTLFDPAEATNRLLLRAYGLIDIANGGGTGSEPVQTDMEGIDRYAVLPNQERFSAALEMVESVAATFYYKELPVPANNTIVRVEKRESVIQLVPKQFAAVRVDAPVFLNIPGIGYVRAKVLKVDEKQMLAHIGKFQYDRHSPLDRKRFRVEAPQGMRLHIVHETHEFEGDVLNMNESYIAFSVPKLRGMAPGSSLSLAMVFPEEAVGDQLATFATAERVEKTGRGYKVVAMCHLRSAEQALLNHYIAQRQMEIIQELRRRER